MRIIDIHPHPDGNVHLVMDMQMAAHLMTQVMIAVTILTSEHEEGENGGRKLVLTREKLDLLTACVGMGQGLSDPECPEEPKAREAYLREQGREGHRALGVLVREIRDMLTSRTIERARAAAPDDVPPALVLELEQVLGTKAKHIPGVGFVFDKSEDKPLPPNVH